MSSLNRRHLLQLAGSSAAALSLSTLNRMTGFAVADESATAVATEVAASNSDSLPMTLYRSLSEQQRRKVCLPVNHASRQYVSNWWYVHQDHRIPGTFDQAQQEMIQEIFDSLHSPDHQDAVNKQVAIDQYGKARNAPAVGFFGTPDDDNFEFIYTGHHVTRRCNAHSDKGQGFGGAPIFYGHFPEEFHETKDHPGNPYWYQGKVFNEFVQALDGKQQAAALVSAHPRSEKGNAPIEKRTADWPGLRCSELSKDQQELFLQTMGRMLAMFRKDDVDATLQSIQSRNMLDELHVSWFDGKYDIGADKVWDTWQIEGPDMVWYFRGQPHIHSYFHQKT